MRSGSRGRLLRWAAEYVVTAERAGVALLAVAAVALFVAFFLPWWSLKIEGILVVNRTVVTGGFSGWGWLSFAVGLLVLGLMVRLVVARGTSPSTKPNNRTQAWVTVAAGAAEVLGNVLFILATPKTEIFVGAGQVASVGVGLVIAMVAGSVLIVGGLLMLVSRRR